ncbi:alpha-humulene synthase-like [Ananas comosus]|uniref:Alpha-humulene synthase-like n=1 Tax=Ananas comosus TaxID=4615 RepID=A0A6P5GXK0_ANACO|nr:alpha-humulene synthase-like [Ananas comosus]
MENSKFNPEKVGRKSGEYHPSLWGDYFITNNPTFYAKQKSKSWMKQRAEELKDEVKKKLHTTSDLHESMSLIDAIQHLGIDYHFTKEIDEALDHLYNTELKSFALHEVALRFRLLRQQGFPIIVTHLVDAFGSSYSINNHNWSVYTDEFNKFKDDKGNFAKTLSNDPRGLLSLYNAAYLGIHVEKILDEAISFSRIHLESKAKDLKPPLANEVSRALVTPLQRRLKRLEARYYISDYEMEDKRDDAILELAKLDFNLVQSLHCEELKNISIWWNDLGLKDKLCYLRDRIVELYFWISGVCFEPDYSHARMIATKVIVLTCILDDTYDVYATLEECRALTDAIQSMPIYIIIKDDFRMEKYKDSLLKILVHLTIEGLCMFYFTNKSRMKEASICRWDMEAIDQLPTYLKDYFHKLISTFEEFEDELALEDKYRVSYLREMVIFFISLLLFSRFQYKSVAKVYHNETEWYAHDYTPTFEEHLQTSIISTAYPMLICACFVGMGNVATKEAFEWVLSIPEAVRASALVSRLMDDITSSEVTNQISLSLISQSLPILRMVSPNQLF